MNITDELKAKLLTAKSAREVAELIKAEGQEITTADAAHIWDEITRYAKQDESELSVDELENISGGSDRNWLKEGCAATVEGGSWCGLNDKCVWLDVTYEHVPIKDPCPMCAGQMYHLKTELVSRFETYYYYRCIHCGYEIKKRG